MKNTLAYIKIYSTAAIIRIIAPIAYENHALRFKGIATCADTDGCGEDIAVVNEFNRIFPGLSWRTSARGIQHRPTTIGIFDTHQIGHQITILFIKLPYWYCWPTSNFISQDLSRGITSIEFYIH